jgi:hypothetical protein
VNTISSLALQKYRQPPELGDENDNMPSALAPLLSSAEKLGELTLQKVEQMSGLGRRQDRFEPAKELHARGIKQINGKKVEDFVQIRETLTAEEEISEDGHYV